MVKKQKGKAGINTIIPSVKKLKNGVYNGSHNISRMPNPARKNIYIAKFPNVGKNNKKELETEILLFSIRSPNTIKIIIIMRLI